MEKIRFKDLSWVLKIAVVYAVGMVAFFLLTIISVILMILWEAFV